VVTAAEEADVFSRIASLLVLGVVIATLPVTLTSCGAGGADESPAPSASSTPGGAPAGGTKMAPGLYDLEDGTVLAVGTVEYRDLEGGFWAVIGGTEAEGDVGKVVAVVANGDEFAQQFTQLEGLSAIVKGTRLEGASTRMAGLEITATSVVAASDAAPGPAE
jgi:hypothetical protein